MYEVGDKIQIRSWEELVNSYKVTFYDLDEMESVNLPDKIDFSKIQDDKINQKCIDRIDIIEHVDKGRGWYYLAKSKTIITKYVIKCEVLNVTDVINNRFEILDL